MPRTYLACQIFRLPWALPASEQIPKFRGLQEHCILSQSRVILLSISSLTHANFTPYSLSLRSKSPMVFSPRNSPLEAIDFEGANKAEKIEIKVFVKGSFAKPPKGLFLKFIFPMLMIRYTMIYQEPRAERGF